MPASQRQKPQRRQPSQQRSRDSVTVILEATAQVLEAHGYQRATTNRIAERAGVSVGTIYQYFHNKDEIIDALLEKEAEAYFAAIRAVIRGPEVTHREAFNAVLTAGYAHQHLVVGIAQVMRHVPGTVYARRSRLIRDELHLLLLDFLTQRGVIARLPDPVVVADVIIAQCEGLTFLGRVHRSPAELVEILTDTLDRYLCSFD